MILLKTKKETILKSLQSITSIVERRHSLPILMNALLSFEDNKLKLTTSDIEIEIMSVIEIEKLQHDQKLTVSAKKLLDILKNMSESNLIVFSYVNERLIISQNKSKYNLQVLPANEFPLINLPPQPHRIINLPQNKLKKIVESISFSMAFQDVRYYLNGLFVKIDSNNLVAVATDGHRLAINSEKIKLDEIQEKEEMELIIPRKAVLEILKLCDYSDENITLSFYQQHLKFEANSLQIITKLIDGKYPDYNKVVPEQALSGVEINRQDFLSCLQRVSILTADKYRGIKVHVNKDKIILHSTNSEQEEAEEQVLCSDSNLDIKMGFNVTYLIEVLSNVKSETIELLLSDPQSSALVLDKSQKNFKYVVMPMRI